MFGVGMMRCRGLFGPVFVLNASVLLSGCAGQIASSNTLEFARAIDDVMVRQIVFNLVRTHLDKEAIPSRIQVTAAVITGKNSATPQVTTPFNAALTATTQFAKQVATATTTTSTDIAT